VRPAHKANNLTAICESIIWRKYGSLDVSQPYGPSQHFTGMALPDVLPLSFLHCILEMNIVLSLSIHLSIHLSIYLPICLSLCLYIYIYFYSCCSHLKHRASVKRFVSLQFLNLRQPVGLLGRVISPTQDRYLRTEQHKHRINAHRHPCLYGIRTHDPSVRGIEAISCLRPAATLLGLCLSTCS
jgi:hypothetical protein